MTAVAARATAVRLPGRMAAKSRRELPRRVGFLAWIAFYQEGSLESRLADVRFVGSFRHVAVDCRDGYS